MGGIAGGGLSLGTLFINIAAKVDEAVKDIQEFGTKTEKVIKEQEKQWEKLAKVGDQFSGLGKQLSVAVTLPIAGIGAAALKLSGDFESAMNKITAVSGTTGAELDALRQQAMKLGADTKFSAQEAAEGMGMLAAAGLNTTQVMAAMPGVLDLAAAGELSIARAAEITTDTLGQFGLAASEAGHIADVLAKGAAASSVSVEQMANALKYVGPPAELAGISLEEVATAIALLGNAGIKGEQAGTSLRGVIESLVHPSKAASEALADLGVKVQDSAGRMKPLDQIFQELKTSGIQAGDMFAIFGSNAASAASVLTKDAGPAWAAMTAEIAKAEGAAKTMSEALMKGLTGQLEQFKGSVETAGIALGNSLKPAMEAVIAAGTKLANWLGQAFEWFQKLPDPIKNGALALAAFAAAIGPILLGIGSLITVITTLGPALAVMATGVGLSTGAMFGWAAAIAVALGALVALGTWIYQNMDAITVDFLTDMIQISEGLAEAYKWLPFMGNALKIVQQNIKDWTADVDAANRRMRENAAAAIAMEQQQEKLKRQIAAAAEASKDGAVQMDKLRARIDDGGHAADQSAKAQKKLAAELKKKAAEEKKAEEAAKKAYHQNLQNRTSLKELAEQIEGTGTKLGLWGKKLTETQIIQKNLKELNQAFGDTIIDTVSPALTKAAADTAAMTAKLKELGIVFDAAPPAIYTADNALKNLGITTSKMFEDAAAEAQRNYEIIRTDGTRTPWEIQKAWVAALEAQKQAIIASGQEWSKENDRQLTEAKTGLEKMEGTYKSAWSGLTNQVSTIVTNFAQDISKSLWEGDMSWSEKGLNALKQLGQAVTSAFIEPAAKAIGDFIGGALKDLLSGEGLGGVLQSIKDIGKGLAKVFGGGAKAPSVPSVPGAPPITDTVGKVGGMALSGIVGMVSGVVSAVSGVISNFQFAAMNKSLDVIVNHTLRIFNELFNFRSDAWSRWEQFMQIKDDLIRPLNSIMDDAARIVVASERIVQITVTGSDPDTVAAKLATQLRLQGAFA